MTQHLLSFILCWIFISPLHPQSKEPINFIHIGLNEGLSQSTVVNITQDKRDNMWFATYDGLNKYDGYHFTVYQHNEQNPHSIGSDIIRTCITDDKGRVWIGTDEGVSLYNADKDRFENFFYLEDKKKRPINGMVEISEKELLLYTSKKKLLLFNTETRQFSNNLPIASLSNIIPTTICRQGDCIYIGSYEGVYAYSVSQNTLKNITANHLKKKDILAILQQSPTRLWIGTKGNGLLLYNPQTKEVTSYTHIPEKRNSISSNYVRSLALDSQNRLWIGTINSLNIYDEKENNFSTYVSTPLVSGSLSQASVRNIFMDSQGGMWLGTYYGGLSYYHPLKNRFHNIQLTVRQNSLNSNIISCIREDTEKNLWIGTSDGGLNHYNTRTQTYTHYTQKEGLGSNDVKAIYVDEANELVYIGTHTGSLSVLHRKSGRLEALNQSDTTRSIYTIEPTKSGELWISSMNTLIRFNPQRKTFTNLTKQWDGRPFLHDRIVALFRDSKHRLWLIREEGVLAYTEKNGELLNDSMPALQTISQKFINCMYEAHDGIFWIGTRSGIYRFDESKQKLTQYTTDHGLPNNVIHGILEDASGKLWISTDKGLSSFQPQTEKFRNFTSDDGLQSNQFTSAYHHAPNGRMYFGGVNGITTFYPEQLVDNPYIPPVVITQLRLFNKTVSPGDETDILEKNINDTHSITLTAKQSVFSLEFVVSNYISGLHNTFAYKLDGYDKEWYYLHTQRTVSYSNLPQGTYRFLVKAANNDGKWNETPTKLEIIILPIWYKTWWAFLLFAVTFIAATTFVFRYFWIQKSMKAQLLMERIDKERQKEVSEMKLRFFINISHELRTPLALILAPLQEVLDKVNDRWMYKQLGHVQRNTNRLLHLVNQLMDYRRAELGVFHLKVHHTHVQQIVGKNFLFYEELAQRKKMRYNFYSEIENKEVLCDPNYLELIVNNLLSNAFKYTTEGQSITVILKEEDDTLLLQVKDTGSGIPINKQGKIFERFYQIDNNHVGSGIGLSLVQRLVELHHGRIELDSAESVGSTFSIYLPTNETVYAPEEFRTESDMAEKEQNYSTNAQNMYMTGIESATYEEEAPDEDNRERKESILIVEDNIDILQYLSSELSNSFHVLEAGNGKEALTILEKEEEVDLILTDAMMPVMDGLQLCKQIKQNLRTCHIPVIILSARADLKGQLEGLKIGADDYIPKPFSLTLVITKIKNLFRTRRRAIQHFSNSLEIEPEKITFNPLDEKLLKRAVEVVEKHLDIVEFSNEEFAREMYMSRSKLYTKMKALTGESTNEFILKIRFNQACKLLKEECYSVTEVSTMVGFNTPSYFSACFKKHFGCQPSEYAKKQNKSATHIL